MKEKRRAHSSCFIAPSESELICINDHHVGPMAELCARLAVLHFGNKIADGPTEAVLNDPQW